MRSNVNFVLKCSKVAAVSGDARRALDICRRATDIAEANGKEEVSMSEVKQALDEMTENPMVRAIKGCSKMERVFLQAVSAELERTGVEGTTFKRANEQFNALWKMNGTFSIFSEAIGGR